MSRLGRAGLEGMLDGALDALADRVLERLSDEPFWRALHCLASRHPEEFVALAQREEARLREADAVAASVPRTPGARWAPRRRMARPANEAGRS